MQFNVSFVYGHNTAGERLSLWNAIRSLTGNLPWLLLGDFNGVRFMNEKVGDDINWPPYMADFNACCNEALLEDLRATGFHLTWDNRSSGERFLARKLDRALVNTAWLSAFPLAEASFLPPRSSDHCSIIVNLGVELYRRKITFKFFNFWITHADFDRLVTEVWTSSLFEGSPMFHVCKKLKLLKERLKVFNQDNEQKKRRYSIKIISRTCQKNLVWPE